MIKYDNVVVHTLPTNCLQRKKKTQIIMIHYNQTYVIKSFLVIYHYYTVTTDFKLSVSLIITMIELFL